MNKNISISCCRIVAMLFIIICHIIKYYEFIPGSSMLGQFFNVGVNVFLLISGIIYGSRNEINWKHFFLRRYLKVLLPVQIWTISVFIFLGCKNWEMFLMYVLGLNGFFRIQSIIGINYPSVGLGHTWFVTIILLCYLLIPLLQKGKETLSDIGYRRLVGYIWIFSILLSLFRIHIFTLALFVTGYLIGKEKTLEKEITLETITKICVLAVFLMVIRVISNIMIDGHVMYSGIIIPLCMSVVGMAIVLLIHFFCTHFTWIESIANSKSFLWVERLSYFVYITHYFFVADNVYNVYTNYGIVCATGVFICLTILFAILLYYVSERISKCIERVLLQ